jgi:ribosome modulation factor
VVAFAFVLYDFRRHRAAKAMYFRDGYNAGIHGNPRSFCPDESEAYKREWMKGWSIGSGARSHGVKE